jgi:ribosomal protein S18 acetylase RimI-like enzyme
MLIRDAGLADAAVIAQIRVDSWRVAYAGLMPEEFLAGLSVEEGKANWSRALSSIQPDRAVLVVEQDGTPCGFAAFGPSRGGDPVEGEIFAIYLRPEAWRRGLGAGLMSAAVGRLTEIGYRAAILWVLDSNDRARRFYEAMGWAGTREEKIDHAFGSPLREVAYRRSLIPTG